MPRKSPKRARPRLTPLQAEKYKRLLGGTLESRKSLAKAAREMASAAESGGDLTGVLGALRRVTEHLSELNLCLADARDRGLPMEQFLAPIVPQPGEDGPPTVPMV